MAGAKNGAEPDPERRLRRTAKCIAPRRNPRASRSTRAASAGPAMPARQRLECIALQLVSAAAATAEPPRPSALVQFVHVLGVGDGWSEVATSRPPRRQAGARCSRSPTASASTSGAPHGGRGGASQPQRAPSGLGHAGHGRVRCRGLPGPARAAASAQSHLLDGPRESYRPSPSRRPGGSAECGRRHRRPLHPPVLSLTAALTPGVAGQG